MLITGFELSSVAGVLTEYKQGWWAKPVTEMLKRQDQK
jgi:hypothetical protein